MTSARARHNNQDVSKSGKDWAVPFCLTAWLLALHAGASDDLTRQQRFQLLYNAPLRDLSAPTARFDPDQLHQQFLQTDILIDVRTTVVNGYGLRRRVVQGSARNVGKAIVRQAVLEVLEAPIKGRGASGELLAAPDSWEVVASQRLGDLDPGRSRLVSIPLTVPDTRIRLYQIRLRTQ